MTEDDSKLSVFSIYRPLSSSTYSKPFSVFLDHFSSFLSFAATTPHKFIITGDFNIHLDNPADALTSQILSLVSSFNLSQHVHFPTHDKNHILDLVITSSDMSLAPAVSCTHWSPSDHFPVFTRLSIKPASIPPPTLHSFRKLHSIDVGSFLTDLESSQLISDPPKSLGPLLPLTTPRQTCSHRQQTLQAPVSIKPMVFCHPPCLLVHLLPR